MEKVFNLLILSIFLFTLIGCDSYNLPAEMPEDFSFSIRWGTDGKYDSSTKVLSNGYNSDLDVECKTELELSHKELKQIYKIIRKAKIDTYEETIIPDNNWTSPSTDLSISFSYNDKKYSVTLVDSKLSDDMNLYINGREVGEAIKKIVEKYILSSEEYKSLPENQKIYW